MPGTKPCRAAANTTAISSGSMGSRPLIWLATLSRCVRDKGATTGLWLTGLSPVRTA